MKDGKCPVYLRIVVNGTRSELSLKSLVYYEDWNVSKGMAKPKNQELKLLNNYLEDVRGRLFTYYKELKIEGEELTAEAVKNAYLGIKKEANNYSLLWLAKEHNKIMANVLKPGSLKNYFTTLAYLKKYLEKAYPAKDILLRQLKYEFITGFEHYIRTTPLKSNDPCTNNGTMKHLERLRKMVTWAVKNEWLDRDPFSAFKLSFKKTEREHLTATELNAVIATELPSASLQKVRDLFLFSCYTGLAFTDLMELKPVHIIEGANNTKRISTTRAKTDVRVNVPLLRPAEEIMARYSTDESAVVNGTVFPRISNQDMNRNLKIIAGLSKVGKLLTFHMARQLEHQAKLNERVKANSVHISLSFDPQEKLTKEKLQDIAKSYMDQIGFGNQPYLVYQHHDAGHPHVHVVTTNITAEGKRIDMNNIGRTLSEKARKSIDKEFKLISPENKKLSQRLQQKESTQNESRLKPVSLQKVQYGKSQTKAAILNVVDYVMNQYKYTSLGEYNAVLKLYNIMADPGQKGSLVQEKKGLVYRVLDEAGNKIGTPIKASQFYNQPTLKNLEVKSKQNEVLRERFALRIKNQIDLAILRNNTLENLSKSLD